MTVRVQAYLRQRLGDRAPLARNEFADEHPFKVSLGRRLEPGLFLRMRAAIPLGECIEGDGRQRLDVERERFSKDREHPEAIGDQHVVQQLEYLGIGGSICVLAHGVEQRRVSVALVSDKGAHQVEHPGIVAGTAAVAPAAGW